MKKILYTTILACAAMLCGCSNDGAELPDGGDPTGKVRVDLNGTVRTIAATTRAAGEGMIDPVGAGVPPWQLGIGIFTIEYGIDGSVPAVADWGKEVYIPYLDNGFFGGTLPGVNPSTPDGNIEYTNRERTAIQNVIYRPDKTYYFFVCAYPYDAMIVDLDPLDPEEPIMDDMLDEDNGATIYFEVDGSQDIMASTMGGGNIDYPYGAMDPTSTYYLHTYGAPLLFSHKLTALRCHFIAENNTSNWDDIYGDIVSIEMVDQPGVLGLNIGKQALGPADPAYATALFDGDPGNTADYPAVSSYSLGNSMPLPVPTGAYDPDEAEEFGYILAMPGQTYKFRITTTERSGLNAIPATYTFPTNEPLAGTIYNLTFKMLETGEITVSAAEVDGEWWLDQTFD